MRYWRHCAVTCTLAVGLAACGSDATEPPPPAFPQVSGTFDFNAEFDAFTATQAYVTGTVTFAQPDPSIGRLDAFPNLTLKIGTSTGTINRFENVSVSTDSRILFQLPSSSISTSWVFEGTVAPDGRSMSGRHTISGTGSLGPASYSGNWWTLKQ